MKKTTPIVLSLFVSLFLFAATPCEMKDSTDHGRLMKVESMLEIQSVLAAYAMAWDRETTSEFANIFHQDAIIIDSWHGKEVERFNGVQAFMDARKSENGNVGGHTLSLVHFKELTETTASTEVIFNYFWYGSFVTSTASVNIRGSYIDEWVKTEKGWRIMKRTIAHENVPEHRAKRYGMME